MSEEIIINKSVLSLKEAILYAKNESPFYRKHFDGLDVNNDFEAEDLKKFPFTTKDDLSENNQEFLCVPISEVAEYVTTSGTSGEPVTIYLTKKDLQRLAENEKTSLMTTGATSDDIFQLMTTIDKQFMAGLAYYLGVQEIGGGMIRIGPGVPALQWKSILLNKPTVLIAVPSFIINLLDYAKSNNIDFQSSSVKSIICIGEPISEDDLKLNILGKRIVMDWKVNLYSTYASTEMSAAFTECLSQNGCHLNEELLHLEVIKEDNDYAKDGEVGEIVITSIGTEGTPLVRYKTGDLARVHYALCSCGRTSPRLGPIIGRKNQMIKFKGTTIFPNSIYEIFDGLPDISCYKVEISKDYLHHDVITILLEKHIEKSRTLNTIIEQCQSKLRVVPHFVFLETDYLRSQVYKKNIRKPEKIVFKG